MQQRPYKRRRIVVDRPFQQSLCLHAIGLGLFVVMALTCGIFVPLLWHLGARIPNDPIEADAAVVMLYMHQRFWALAGICTVVVTLAALRLSHRIAGPLVRYKRYLRLVAVGKLPPPLRTRPRDYLKEEVDVLNEAVVGVRERVEAIRAAAAKARRELNAVLDRGGQVSSTDLAGLVASQDELHRCLDGFREATPVDCDAPAPAHVPGVVLAFPGGARGDAE